MQYGIKSLLHFNIIVDLGVTAATIPSPSTVLSGRGAQGCWADTSVDSNQR